VGSITREGLLDKGSLCGGKTLAVLKRFTGDRARERDGQVYELALKHFCVTSSCCRIVMIRKILIVSSIRLDGVAGILVLIGGKSVLSTAGMVYLPH
jgi:hypothetical protein